MFWTNLKIKITDDFDSLESMLLTGIFSPFFFPHFSVLLKILVRMSLRQQQSVEEM